MTANGTHRPPRPAPEHGKSYLAVYVTAAGTSGRLIIRHNGFEFNTPYSQAVHETRALSARRGTALLRVSVAPLERALIPLTISRNYLRRVNN